MPRVEGIHKFRGGETEADFHMFSLLGFQQVNYQEIRDSPTSPGAPGEAGRKPVLAPGDPLKHRLGTAQPQGAVHKDADVSGSPWGCAVPSLCSLTGQPCLGPGGYDNRPRSSFFPLADIQLHC